MIFSIRDMIINFVFYQLLNILFFVTERENRSFILETCKSVYYIVFLIITKYFSEINNKIKVLDASNQSFLKLVLFFNGNFINNTILVNKDCDEKLNIIYEKKINEFFSINFIENDVLAFKLYSSSKKLKEFNIVNKLNSNTKDNFNYCCKNNQEKNLLNNNYHSSIAMNKFEKIGKKGNDFIELGMKNKIKKEEMVLKDLKSKSVNVSNRFINRAQTDKKKAEENLNIAKRDLTNATSSLAHFNNQHLNIKTKEYKSY